MVAVGYSLREVRAEAIAGIALTLLGVALSIIGVPRWLGWVIFGVAIVLFLVAGIRWRRSTPDLPLVNRIVDLANRVLACALNGHEQTPFEYPSAYGVEQDMANFVASREGGKIADEQGVMTDELWADIRSTIEEMGRAGCKNYRLQPYLSRCPEMGDCTHLAAELFAQASKMANQSPA